MRKMLFLVLSLLSFSLSPAILYANSSTSPSSQSLLVLISKEAKIIKAPAETGTYLLRLKGVNPKVVYFNNRPSRVTGQINMDKFINQWIEGSFKTMPPNALMEAVQLSGKKLNNKLSSYAFTMSNPHYDKDKDELSFTIKPMTGNSLFSAVGKKNDYVAIFIDDVCISCIHG